MAEPFAGTVRAAGAHDLDAMLALLRANDLPTDGVREHREAFLVAERDGVLHGLVGLEHYGDAALLRSLVVQGEARGTGLGAQLVQAIEALARARGAETLVLLTTTAAEWFPRFGYERVPREAVPMAVTASVEFRGACPASATVMQRSLGTA